MATNVAPRWGFGADYQLIATTKIRPTLGSDYPECALCKVGIRIAERVAEVAQRLVVWLDNTARARLSSCAN
jgi:hypothetical protein